VTHTNLCIREHFSNIINLSRWTRQLSFQLLFWVMHVWTHFKYIVKCLWFCSHVSFRLLTLNMVPLFNVVFVSKAWFISSWQSMVIVMMHKNVSMTNNFLCHTFRIMYHYIKIILFMPFPSLQLRRLHA